MYIKYNVVIKVAKIVLIVLLAPKLTYMIRIIASNMNPAYLMAQTA